MFTIGSLFDGSGGFPLAAFMCGGVPTWAAEIEPYPIAVTRSRFPYMKHLGSVTDVNGAEVEPVDLITFGSPCQDLSVAGKRAGLKHEANGDEETTRSGLFMEAVRIIREMREATNGVYPRFALWENVPGAFSSNKGEDFRIVLEELIKIVEPTAVMPTVPKNGWPYADHYCGDGWSLAYRTLDSQYWGVPQRRNRIHLVLDLGGQCAGKVLFEREGLRGYFEEGRAPWKEAAGNAEGGSGTADCEIPYTLKIRSGCEGGGKGALVQEDMSATLSTLNDQYLFQPVTLEPGIAAREGGHVYEGVSGTLRANAGDNQMAVAYPVEQLVLDDQGGSQISVREDGKCPTLRAEAHGNVPCVMEPDRKVYEWHSQDLRVKEIKDDVSPTLSAGMGMGGANNTTPMLIQEILPFDTTRVTSPMNYSNPKWGDPCHPLAAGAHPPAVVYSIENHPADSRVNIDTTGKVQTLTSRMGTGGGNVPMVLEERTPTYCLQGNGIDRADTAGYNGKGWKEGVCYTLNTIDRPAVAYGIGNGQANQSYSEEQVGALNCMHDQQAVAYGVDCRNATEYPESMGAIQAAMNHNLNSNGVVRVQYVVRRLTPTECARLQGFPDYWGHPDKKSEFTDEEYEFWLNVRNTHAAINGKTVKSYTKEQMLTWYNKLHTDSSEYKLWGNGIALPTALYVMQGIAEVFK